MAFTNPPKTWTAALVTVANLNTELRDQLIALRGLRNTTLQNVANTTTETTVLTQTIGANTLPTDGIIEAILQAHYLNFTGGAKDLTVRIKFGGTTVWADTINIPSSAEYRPVEIRVWIANMGATNSQTLSATMMIADGNNVTTGSGDASTALGSSTGYAAVFGSDPDVALAIDTTAAKDVAVTIQHGTADALAIFTKRFWLVKWA